ncbi:MAG: VanZ family protein [Endozoicomonas sp.]
MLTKIIRFRAFWQVLSLAWFATVVGFSFAKGAGLAKAELRTLESFAGGDLALHVWVAGLMAFLAIMAVPLRWLDGYLFRLFSPVFLILIFGCLLDELLQQYIPTRHFSWLDFLASFSGLVIGNSTALLLRSRL